MSNKVYRFVLPGRPITKKNSMRVFGNGKRKVVLPSKAFMEYQDACLWEIKGAKVPKFEGKVSLKAEYWLPNRRGLPDLINLLQATCDILEESGVVVNDRNIVSFNGSRVVGIDKKNPRAEIELREVQDG